ncbi:MAG: hypothetical protein EBE86_020795 [Hormoscilla sp. GUM202]|nr:hypothetical protein [Hormoscilla sp. GM7CHS1pb]MBO1349657.1 hypothetical protein [Hormoscilla sp. GUM202]
MAVDEYWIVDVDHVQVIAFTIKNQSSQRITDSLVLPGLTVSLLEEVLRRSRRMNQMQVGAWLLVVSPSATVIITQKPCFSEKQGFLYDFGKTMLQLLQTLFISRF